MEVHCKVTTSPKICFCLHCQNFILKRKRKEKITTLLPLSQKTIMMKTILMHLKHMKTPTIKPLGISVFVFTILLGINLIVKTKLASFGRSSRLDMPNQALLNSF